MQGVCEEVEVTREKVAAFWKKRRKNFFDFEPEALQLHGPGITKFFCFFWFTKRSLFLAFLTSPRGWVCRRVRLAQTALAAMLPPAHRFGE
jgi:hypothetical protein